MATNRHSIVKSTTISTSLSQITGPAQQRRALIFTPPLTGSYTISPSGDSLSAGLGLNMLASSSVLELTYEEHGDIVQKSWFAIGSGTLGIGFVETYEES
jgi:hypothetical protein